MLLTPEKLYDLLVMRSEGKRYDIIGKELGITPKQISNQYRTTVYYYRKGYFVTVKNMANLSGRPVHEIVGMLKQKFNYKVSRFKPPLMIKIGDYIPNLNLWYAKRHGQVFRAKRTPTHYIINDNELFKVNLDDCTEC